jgi:hypothetical protein
MLGTLPRERVTQDIHRFANITHVAVFATDKGFTLEEVAEIMRFNRDDVIKDLMKAPFQRKAFFDNKFGPLTRFSNGEWPVSYGALGRTTAGKEVAHHYGRKAAGNAAASRPVHYSIVRCRFSGEVVDLRPKLPAWPQLISANYTFCNGFLCLGWGKSYGRGWDAALLGLLEAVAHDGEAGGVVVEESLIKVLYRFHQNNDDSKCEIGHTSLPIRPSKSPADWY